MLSNRVDCILPFHHDDFSGILLDIMRCVRHRELKEAFDFEEYNMLVSNQAQLRQALLEHEPLIEITNDFTVDGFFYIDYYAMIASASGSEEYIITRSAGSTEAVFYVAEDGVLTLERLIIDGNSSQIIATGSAIDVRGSLTLAGSTIRNAAKDDVGGGIYIGGGASATLLCSIIEHCSANYGGGVYVESGATLEVNGGAMRYNTCSVMGGAIFISLQSTASLKNVTIENNSAEDEGDGIYNVGILEVSGCVRILDGLCIPAPQSAVQIVGCLCCSKILLETSQYIVPNPEKAPFIVAVASPQYGTIRREDICVFVLPGEGFDNWYLVRSADNRSLLLNVYDDYDITYENLLGAENGNPDSYNEKVLPLFLKPPSEPVGFIFSGWYNRSVGGEEITVLPPGTAGDITLFARWIRIPEIPCPGCCDC